MVHLVDGRQSVLLAGGALSLVRISQGGSGVVAFVRVGGDLHWPLGWDEPVVQLDRLHYVFNLQVPAGDDAEGGAPGGVSTSAAQQQQQGGGAAPAGAVEAIAYGVTFEPNTPPGALAALDQLLQQYCTFTRAAGGTVSLAATAATEPAPSQGQIAAAATDADVAGGQLATAEGPHRVVVASKEGEAVVAEVEGEKGLMVERSAAFWAGVAPDVNEYQSALARGIAGGAGTVIRGIIGASDAAVAQVARMGQRAEGRLARAEDAGAEISPGVMRQIKRVRALSRMTDSVASGVLTGVVRTTGFVSGRLFKNNLGRRAFKMLPGEVAVVSLDAFGRLFDAVELAGTNFLNTTSVVTSGVVTHRYGAKAGEVAEDTLATTGHAIHTAWTVAKLRKAIDPRSTAGGFSKTQALKGVVQGLARPKV